MTDEEYLRDDLSQNTQVDSEIDNAESHYLNADDDAWGAVYDEETASEITADDIESSDRNTDFDGGAHANSIYGWAGLALSVFSFFWLPVIMAVAGIIVGIVARNRGARTLGITAIITGAASLVITLFLLPFF